MTDEEREYWRRPRNNKPRKEGGMTDREVMQPDFNSQNKWAKNGGDAPLCGKVQVMFASGDTEVGMVNDFDWYLDYSSNCIIQYKELK